MISIYGPYCAIAGRSPPPLEAGEANSFSRGWLACSMPCPSTGGASPGMTWSTPSGRMPTPAAAAQIIKTDDLTDTVEDVIRGAERHHQAGWLCTIATELEGSNG